MYKFKISFSLKLKKTKKKNIWALLGLCYGSDMYYTTYLKNKIKVTLK